MSMGDIRQRTVLEVQSIGADTVSILAQATREYQAQFRQMVQEFDAGAITAAHLIAELGKLASGLTNVANVANHDAAELAKLAAAQEKAAAASASFVDKANAALQKKDAEEAKLDGESRKRMDQKAAKDKATLDAIGASADKAAKAAQKAADDMAAADARKSAANDKAMDDLEGYAALQRKLGDMERQSADEAKAAIASTTAARRAGTEAVADHIVKVRGELAGITATRDAEGDAMRARIDGYARAERATQKYQDAQVKLIGTTRKVGEEGQKSGQAAARGFLELSRGVEDFAVAGPLGVLNNIPGVFQNIGQAVSLSGTAVAGLTAGVSGLATFAYVVYQNWDRIKDTFKDLFPAKLFEDIESLETKLKLLDGIKVKTEVDYIDISNARRELMRLKEEESSYDRLKGKKTEEQEKRGKVVSEAIVESGGGDDYTSSIENITQAMVDKMAADSPEVQSQKAYIQERLAREQNLNLDDATRNRAAAEAEGARTRLDDHMKGIRQTAVGITVGAAAGRSLETGQLAAFVAANEGTLEARGVDTVRLGAGLENAHKAHLFADEKRKMAADLAKRNAELAKTDEDAEDIHHTNIHGQFEQGLAEFQARSAAMADSAGAEQVRINQRIEAERLAKEKKAATAAGAAETKAAAETRKIARGAPKRALQGQQQLYGREFQEAYGADDKQARVAGPMIAAMVNKGATPQEAGGAVFQKLLAEMVKLGRINQEQQAEMLMMKGFAEEAARVIQQANAKINGLGRMQPRAGMQMRAFMPMGGG